MFRKTVIYSLLVCTICTFGFLGFGTKKKDVVAVVGKEVITVTQLNERLNAYPTQYTKALESKENKVRVLDILIDEQLLLVAAKKAGFSKTVEFKTQLALAKDQLLLNLLIREKVDKNINITEQDLQDYYKTNQAQFEELEQRRASHILLKTESEAKTMRRLLRKGSKFADLAKKNSQDPGSRDRGGDLGWFKKGQLVPEFENAVFGLKKGQLSSPVKTQFGFHIIRLDDTNVRPKLDYTQVKDRVQQAVISQKKQELTQKLIADLKKEVKISRDLEKIN